MYFTTKN